MAPTKVAPTAEEVFAAADAKQYRERIGRWAAFSIDERIAALLAFRFICREAEFDSEVTNMPFEVVAWMLEETEESLKKDLFSLSHRSATPRPDGIGRSPGRSLRPNIPTCLVFNSRLPSQRPACHGTPSAVLGCGSLWTGFVRQSAGGLQRVRGASRSA